MTPLHFWPTADAIRECMPSEAEVISAAAFLAVHQPVRLLRRSLTNRSAPAEDVDERAVLEALLTPHLPEGYVIVPLVGPSGVGKSHLVRWLHLHTTGDRHVVLIPKSTSLRRILDDILSGLSGAVYADLRRQLATAQEKLDDISGEERLLAEFRSALRRRTEEARQVCQAAKQSGIPVPADQRAVAETHGPGLYGLLEGATKEALLEGVGGRSVFRALVQRVTTGRIDAEQGEFTPADLTFDGLPAGKLSEGQRKYLGKLKANTQGDREAAARVLNEVKDGAVGQLLGLGENQLAELFRRVREELLADKKELVLLIEDFTTLAGVQRGLLDVIKMEGVRGGKAVLFPLRTALAVTEGFLAGYDTLLTRTGHEYVFREHPAGEREVLDTLTDLAGAYLNAARLGKGELERWYDGTGHNPDAPPPSFDRQLGELSDADRAAVEAFGRSPRGHALFPFNRAAVERLARQHMAPDGAVRLIPRDFIKRVLHDTLLHHREQFEQGEFPPAAFHQFNPQGLGIDVTAWLSQARRADHPRYAALLGYWGDRPRTPADVRLPAGVYKAFGLVPLTDELTDEPTPPSPTDAPTLPPPPPVPQALAVTPTDKAQQEIAARERVLEEWATKKQITQTDARALRNELLDMIAAALDWDAELLAGPRDLSAAAGKRRPAAGDEEEEAEEFEPEAGPPVEQRFPKMPFRLALGADRIYLPYTGSKTADPPHLAAFTLCTEAEFDTPEAFNRVRFELRAVVRFHTHKTFDYPGGDEDRGWYAGLAERAAGQTREYLRRRYERVPDDPAAVAAVAQALYLSARVLNLDAAHSPQDAEVVAAVLAPGPGPSGVPADGGAWADFRQWCAAQRVAARDFLLRRLAARQGQGYTLHGIDAARLLAALVSVRKTCRLDAEFPDGPLEQNAEQVRGFVTRLGAKRMAAAVAARRDEITEWADAARGWLGDGFDKKGFAADCRGLLTQANALGVFHADVTAETLRQRVKEFEEAEVAKALDAAGRLKEEASPGVVLTAVVQAPDDAMRKVDAFRLAFQAFADQTAAAAAAEVRKKLALANTDADADPAALLPAVGRHLDADLRTLLAACGGQVEPAVGEESAQNAPAAVPTFTGRFAALTAALARLSAVDTAVQQVNKLQTERTAVSNWAAELPALTAQHRLYSARGVNIDPAPDGAKAAGAVAAARAKVAESPLDIAKGRTFNTLTREVDKLIAAYQESVTTAWRGWVDRTAPKLDDAELVPFEQNPDYRPTVADIRTKQATLRRSRNEPADTEAEFAVVEATAAALRMLLGRLPTEAPAEVKAFLAATNSKDGAPLALLTPDVLKWLAANGQLDKYRILR